jgi:ubiquinone/menaquinone biosynthesis C-methylase UbiE
MIRGDINKVYEYWNSRPCNIRHSSKPQNSVEFFDEVQAKKYRSEDHKLDFLALGKWLGKNVLELGCGLGSDAIMFAKAGANVTCVDLTDNSLKLCKKNFEVHGLSGEFFLGNIEELDTFLPDKKYDLIYSFGVIHHTPNPKKVFEKAHKYLKEDGELRCMLYSRFSYKLFWLMNTMDNWKLNNTDELIQNYSEAQSGCPVTYTYTFDEIEDLVGPWFKVNKIWKDHIFMWDIESYKKNIFKRDTAFEGVSDEFLTKMKKELGWHTMFIASRSNK